MVSVRTLNSIKPTLRKLKLDNRKGFVIHTTSKDLDEYINGTLIVLNSIGLLQFGAVNSPICIRGVDDVTIVFILKKAYENKYNVNDIVNFIGGGAYSFELFELL